MSGIGKTVEQLDLAITANTSDLLLLASNNGDGTYTTKSILVSDSLGPIQDVADASAASLASSGNVQATPTADVTGATDQTSIFRAFIQDIYNRKTSVSTNWSTPVVRDNFVVPAGQYKFTGADPFGGSIATVDTSGLTIRGSGRLQTALQFTPTVPGQTLFDNSGAGLGGHWPYYDMSDMSIYSDNFANGFCHNVVAGSNGIGGNINTRLQFTGSWAYLWKLEGDNNNDNTTYREQLYYGAFGAVLLIPSTGSAQHVNHWFSDCRAFLPSGNWLDISKGGSIHVLNWTADAPGIGSPGTLFQFKQSVIDIYNGQFNFSADFGRPEFTVSGTTQKLINCVWPTGNVTWRNMDMSSSVASALPPTNTLAQYTLNGGGPTVSYQNSFISGVHEVLAPSNPDLYAYRVKFEDTLYSHDTDIFANGAFKITPQMGETNTACLPTIELDGVRGVAQSGYESIALRQASHAYTLNQRYLTSDGYIWYCSTAGTTSATATVRPGRAASYADGTAVFFQNDLYPQGIFAKDASVKVDAALPFGNVTPKCVVLTGKTSKSPARLSGPVVNGDVKFILPPNAKIIAFESHIPSGVSAQATTATWLLKNATYSGITTIATIAAANPSTGDAQRVICNYDTGAYSAGGMSAFGNRIIVLEAQTDVTAEILGAFFMVWYI